MVDEIRVLHVDDEPDFATLTAEFLERVADGLDVATETSAADGLARLDDAAFDCLVSDYQMPGMDGIELLEAVRGTAPDLPFILYTGQGSEEIASEALTAGATEYLRKGSGSEHYRLLANRIENAVESHRARERVAELERIRATLADVNQALVRASSREEIETWVCDILVDVETVRLAAVSVVDEETGRLERRAWAGEAASLLEELSVTLDGPPDGEVTPHERAYAEREVAASRDVQADPAFEPWREATLESGCRALAVVPLAYEEELYGLLSVYGGRPQTVDDDARDILAELGDDVGIAISAVETRQELAASEARYRTLAETVSDAILTIDETSTVTYANPATERLFGYDREELVGAPLTSLMPERLREPHREGVARYLRTGEPRLDWTGVELAGRREDGTEFPLSVSFGEFEHDGEHLFTGVVRDVTERTARETELERRNEYLDEFAGIVAHDLRNPLTIALGRLELAREEVDSDHLGPLADALDRMEHLVEDLLRLAREGQAVDEVGPVPLDEVVDVARGAVDDDAVDVAVDAPLGTVVAHRSRVRAMLENLFRNAVEHGDPPVTVRVTMLDDGFAVEDDGPGISEADRDEVFGPGYTTKDDGTGFGLNIVEKIADAHGWDVDVADGTDGGARFEVTGVELDP